MPDESLRAAASDAVDGISPTYPVPDGPGTLLISDLHPNLPDKSVILGENAFCGLGHGALMNKEGVCVPHAPRHLHTEGLDRTGAVLHPEGGWDSLIEYRYTEGSTSLPRLPFSWDELLDENFLANYTGFSNAGFTGHHYRGRAYIEKCSEVSITRFAGHPSQGVACIKWRSKHLPCLPETLQSVGRRAIRLLLYSATLGLRGVQWLCKGCTHSGSLGYQRGSTIETISLGKGERPAGERVWAAPLEGVATGLHRCSVNTTYIAALHTRLLMSNICFRSSLSRYASRGSREGPLPSGTSKK
jgi:hypothetical protein